MKKKDLEQLNTKNKTELLKQLGEHKDKLWSLKVDLASGKVKNVREIHHLKRNIARILTVLSKKKEKTSQ